MILQTLYLLGLTTLHAVSGNDDGGINQPGPSDPSVSQDPPHIPYDLERSHLFQELMSWHETLAEGWITRKNTLYKRILQRALADEPVLLEYFLDPANNKRQRTLDLDDSDNVEVNYLGLADPLPFPPVLPFCSGDLTRPLVHSSGQDVSSGSFQGCRWVTDDPSYEWYLVCDAWNITRMPVLPTNARLDLFELSETQVEEVPERSFDKTSVKSIRINGNSVRKVSPDAFLGSSNTTLVQMMHNKLDTIWFDGAFAGLEKLVTLQLDFNGISLLGLQDLCREKSNDEDITEILPNLRVLSLRQNPLKVIPRTFFAPFRSSKVIFLVLDNCLLMKIHEDAMSYFPHLLELELSGNPKLMDDLRPVFRSLSKSGAKLRDLGLANNALQTPPLALSFVASSLVSLDLHKNVFVTLGSTSFPFHMPLLTSLNLAGSNLKTLEAGVFDGMPHLETLMINGNHFKHIPPPVGTLAGLLTLDISDNKVDADFDQTTLQIQPDTFVQLERLQTLVLTNSEMSQLDEDSFRGLTKLRMLYLNGCRLERIPEFVFKSTPALKILNLSHNRNLGTPNASTFYGLASLEKLYMNSTGFRISRNHPQTATMERTENVTIDFVTMGSAYLERGAIVEHAHEPFEYLQMLTTLDLYDNGLTFVHRRLFRQLPLLQRLILTQNNIETWTEPVFQGNIHLAAVFLNNNELHTVSPGMISDFSQRPVWPALSPKVIDLSDNPFHCDKGVCDMKSARDEIFFKLSHWDQQGFYMCRELTGDQGKLEIPNLTTDFCRSLDVNPDDTTVPETVTEPTEISKQKPDPGSGFDRSVIIGLGCATGLLVLAGFAYWSRTHVQLLWFGVKLNVITREKTEDPDCHYDYDVFISYSQMDSDFVQELVPRLEGTGKLFGCLDSTFDLDAASTCSSTRTLAMNTVNEALRVCLHLRDFQVGAPITENIVECVDRSKSVLVVISKNYLASQWCLFEMNLAYHRLIEGRRSSIILILLEPIPSNKKTKVLSHLMRSRTYLQWPGSTSSAVEKKVFWKRLKTTLSSETESNC